MGRFLEVGLRQAQASQSGNAEGGKIKRCAHGSRRTVKTVEGGKKIEVEKDKVAAGFIPAQRHNN